jgi:flagellum-specific peptidoglycan hydrolase FlgJ
MDRKGFINAISKEMITVCRGTGLFPSVMIAQACLESADGKSLLSAKYHNYFGMKPGSTWTGAVVEMPTKEYIRGQMVTVKQPFRAYSSLQDGFEDHIKLLQRVSVYKNAGVFTSKTPEEQAGALLKAGYATDPKYASKLIAIINENNLKQYDLQTNKL